MFDLFPDSFSIVSVDGQTYVQLSDTSVTKHAKVESPSDSIGVDPKIPDEEITKAKEKLRELVIAVLIDKPEGLHTSQFWERYYHMHGQYGITCTDPHLYGITGTKKSDLLKLLKGTFKGDPCDPSSLLKLEPSLRKGIETPTLASSTKGCQEKGKGATSAADRDTVGRIPSITNTTKPEQKPAVGVESLQGHDVETLRNEVVVLLNENPSGIPECEFWNFYAKKYQLNTKQLPKPKQFNVSSRLEILHLFSDVYESFEQGSKAFVRSTDSMSGWYIDRSGSGGQPPTTGQPRGTPRHYSIPPTPQHGNMQPHQQAPIQYGQAGGAYGFSAPQASSSSALYARFQGHGNPSAGGGSTGRTSREWSVDRDRSGSRERQRGGQYWHDPHQGYSSRSSSSTSTGSRPPYHGGNTTRVSKTHLDSVAEDCIERLAESKEYVSGERIEKLLLQTMEEDSLDRIGVRHIEEINVVREHVRKQCKVNAYIQAFIMCRSIGTLYELHEHFREFVPEKQEFEKLLLGPLIKQPLIYKFFQIPQSGEITELTTTDILEYLKQYLTEKNLWTSRDSTLSDFLTYIVEKRGLDNPYELGIRMRSLPLAIQVKHYSSLF